MRELKNEQAIEALADMFDPIVEIASDEEVKSAAQSNDKVLMVCRKDDPAFVRRNVRRQPFLFF